MSTPCSLTDDRTHAHDLANGGCIGRSPGTPIVALQNMFVSKPFTGRGPNVLGVAGHG